MTQGPKNFREAQVAPVFIYGPPGSGKTRYSHNLATLYSKDTIVDDWVSGMKIPHNALILTQEKVEGAIPIEVALASIGVRPKVDLVNHPPHYKSHPSGVECITISEHFNFCLGNAIKYIWRAGEKENEDPIQALEKARWYLDREIARRKGAKP